MCRIERYNLIFPDNHIEQREQLLNTCPRGTPSNPCRRCEYVTLHNFREATQEDIEERNRRLAPVIEPRRPSPPRFEPSPQRDSSSLARRRHPGVLSGLSIGFKSWSPFSSKSKKEKKMATGKKLSIERTPRGNGGVTLVERPPRAPTPPPVLRTKPKMIEIIPKEEDRKRHKKHGRKQKIVVIHQKKKKTSDDSSDDSSSSEDDSPSSPEPTRPHRRPNGPRSPSPASRAAAEKVAHKERERAARERERADHYARIAEAERNARLQAERDHDHEVRRERRRAIEADEERLRLESDDVRRRRQDQEERERASFAQRRQFHEDAERLHLPHVRHPIALHQRNSFEDDGRDFEDDALAAARRRRQQRVETQDERPQTGLRRRRTINGTHGVPHEGRGRGHERGRHGASR